MRDEALEQAINAAGRDKVFAMMRAAGWSSLDAPPKHAWWAAVRLAKESGDE